MNIFGKKKEERDYSVTTAPQSYLFNSSVTPALSIPAVFACTSLISNTVSSLPLNVFVDGLKVDNHPKQKIIDEPIENVTTETWINTIVRNVLINGNAYVEITPKGLVIQDAINVLLLLDDRGDIVKYQVGSRDVRKEDMLHFKRLTKDERGQIGLSLQDTFSLLFDEIKNTSLHTSDYMEHGLTTGLWLEIKGKVQPETLQKIRDAFKSLYQGVANRTTIPTLTDGMQLREIKNNTLKDSAIDELKTMQLKEVAMIFNVPITLLDGSLGNYSSTVEANLLFLKSCIAPLLRSIEAELNLKLNTGTGIEYKFDTSAYLAGSFSQQVATLSTSVNSGILTSNEARERLGYEKVKDGDILYAPAGTPTPKGETA